jgi:hypothetical protein
MASSSYRIWSGVVVCTCKKNMLPHRLVKCNNKCSMLGELTVSSSKMVLYVIQA